MKIEYRHIQIGLLVAIVGLFFAYVALDIIAYPLSDFAENTMVTIWGLFLILLDVQAIAKIMRRENGIEDDSPVTTDKP